MSVDDNIQVAVRVPYLVCCSRPHTTFLGPFLVSLDKLTLLFAFLPVSSILSIYGACLQYGICDVLSNRGSIWIFDPIQDCGEIPVALMPVLSNYAQLGMHTAHLIRK